MKLRHRQLNIVLRIKLAFEIKCYISPKKISLTLLDVVNALYIKMHPSQRKWIGHITCNRSVKV